MSVLFFDAGVASVISRPMRLNAVPHTHVGRVQQVIGVRTGRWQIATGYSPNTPGEADSVGGSRKRPHQSEADGTSEAPII